MNMNRSPVYFFHPSMAIIFTRSRLKLHNMETLVCVTIRNHFINQKFLTIVVFAKTAKICPSLLRRTNLKSIHLSPSLHKMKSD